MIYLSLLITEHYFSLNTVLRSIHVTVCKSISALFVSIPVNAELPYYCSCGIKCYGLMKYECMHVKREYCFPEN